MHANAPIPDEAADEPPPVTGGDPANDNRITG